MHRFARLIVAALGVGTLVALRAAPAFAKPAPVTKITFKLDAHEVTQGSPVTSSVLVQTRSANHWVALPGVTLTVNVDGADVGTVVTDSNGLAAISYVTESPGDHVMKVVFAGDELHKRAQRAQGFTVTAAPQPPTT